MPYNVGIKTYLLFANNIAIKIARRTSEKILSPLLTPVWDKGRQSWKKNIVTGCYKSRWLIPLTNKTYQVSAGRYRARYRARVPLSPWFFPRRTDVARLLTPDPLSTRFFISDLYLARRDTIACTRNCALVRTTRRELRLPFYVTDRSRRRDIRVPPSSKGIKPTRASLRRTLYTIRYLHVIA